MIKPKKNTISTPHSQKQYVSFPQSEPSPGLMFSKPEIQNMCFQPSLNKTFCLMQSLPTCQQFKYAKLQNKKIRLSASAPIGFQQKVHNTRIEKSIPTLTFRETIPD